MNPEYSALASAASHFLPSHRPHLFVLEPASLGSFAAALGAGKVHAPTAGAASHPPAELLSAIGWRADLLLAAPHSFADLQRAASFLTPRGELLAILEKDEAERWLGNLSQPLHARTTTTGTAMSGLGFGAGVWLTLEAGDRMVLFFALSHRGSLPHRINLDRCDAALADDPEAMLAYLKDAARRRPVWREGHSVIEPCEACKDSPAGWNACVEEDARLRTGRGRDNLFLAPVDGTLRVSLTGYQSRLHNLPLRLERGRTAFGQPRLAGRTLAAILMDADAEKLLSESMADERVRVSPRLAAQLAEARRDIDMARAPFYPPSEYQRLAWLVGCPTGNATASPSAGAASHSHLLCTKSIGPFSAGQRYAFTTRTITCERDLSRPNILGAEEDVTYYSRELCVRVSGLAAPGAVAPGKTRAVSHIDFCEWPAMRPPKPLSDLSGMPAATAQQLRAAHAKLGGTLPITDVHGKKYPPLARHRLTELAEHFETPHVPDVAELFPERLAANLDALARIEADQPSTLNSQPFTFRDFQRDDYARFACHPGGILGHDPGGGKTLALYTLPQLYAAGLTLIVAPEGLHEQIMEEGRSKFGIVPKRLMNRADLAADKDLQAALRDVRNAQPRRNPAVGWWITSYTALAFNDADEWMPDTTPGGLPKVSSILLKERAAMRGFVSGDHDQNIGVKPPSTALPITCVLRPSLSTVLADVFDCVVCDEAVRIKSDDSFVGLGIRQMRAPHRIVLTGTPIKNRLEDIFWLASWSAGSHWPENAGAASHRFPYPATVKAKTDFAETHLITEINHTRAENHFALNGSRRTFKTRLPRVTNVHSLWRTLAPVVLRRKKEGFGADLVPKSVNPILIQAGTAQKAVYGWHVKHAPSFTKEGKAMNPVAAVLAQLNNLRTAALCPDAPGLRSEWLPAAEQPSARSYTDQTPLQAACLAKIEELLSTGEQCVVMSPFTHFSQTLFMRLTEARVSAVLLDGHTSPKERGRLAARFKAKGYSVLIAGQQSMGEGHSFDGCRNLILPSLHWAFDVNRQSEDRVHRLTSKLPVNIYVLITAGTIYERLYALYAEKAESSAIALDGGHTIGVIDDEEEVSMGALLREAISGFDPTRPSIDEQKIENAWPVLRQRLGHAETRFREWLLPVALETQGRDEPPLASADLSAGRTKSDFAHISSPPISADLARLLWTLL